MIYMLQVAKLTFQKKIYNLSYYKYSACTYFSQPYNVQIILRLPVINEGKTYINLK